MKRLLCILTLLFWASPVASKEYTTLELLDMTLSSFHADVEQNIAYARGVARITEESAKGYWLARRGALADARRALLLLKERIANESDYNSLDYENEVILSGKVPPIKLLSETVQDGLYFVEVEARLNDLLNDDVMSLGNILNLRIEEK